MYNPLKDNMAEQFDIKKGFVNILKQLLHDEGFIVALVNLLLGRKDAANELKIMLLRKSYRQSLNEVVVAHRLANAPIEEGKEEDSLKDKNLLRKIAELPQKSLKFQSDVIVKTLKKPGMVAALYKLIKSGGKDPTAYTILIPAVVDSIEEVASEDEEMQVSLSENININDNSVNIMVGRFQPFTLGHLKCLAAIKNSLGVPTLLCVIPGNGDDKHPFRGEIQDEMLERIKMAYPSLIADVAYVKNAFIEPWVLAAKERGLEPVSWTCGTDRAAAYENMVAKHGQNYGLNPDFKVYCLDRADDNISASSVRECLLNDDREGFMKQMPDALYDMYDEMREVMVGDTIPSFQTISESRAYREFKETLDKGIKELLK